MHYVIPFNPPPPSYSISGWMTPHRIYSYHPLQLMLSTCPVYMKRDQGQTRIPGYESLSQTTPNMHDPPPVLGGSYMYTCALRTVA